MVGLNMRSHYLICFLVGLAFADQISPAWKDGTQYIYDVQGRSLAGISGISDEYTGIVLRAKLIIQPLSTGILRGQVNVPEYAEIQTRLPKGWMSKLPQSQLNYRPLEMTNKPFEIILNNGAVKDIVFEQEVLQWEANVIKSLASQLQLDTNAENVIPSILNVLPKQGSDNAVFKTIEDTVTGIATTIYDIHPMPEFILQSEPHLAPLPHLKGDGSIIEIVKNKNYTESHKLPGYWSDLGQFGKWRPTANRFGSIIHRNSLSRAVVTGTLQRYTIQYSETSNTMVVGPKKNVQGTVNSMMSIKLAYAEQTGIILPKLESPVRAGSLVYSYQQEGSDGRVSKGRSFDVSKYRLKGDDSAEESQVNAAAPQIRNPRSVLRDEGSMESQEEWTLPKTKLGQSHHDPMLPLMIGYKGLSIKHAPGIEIIDKMISIAQNIASDLERPQEMVQKQTLAKFITLTSILRLMDEQELRQAVNRMYTPESKSHRYNAWVVLRDSIAETGTGPAFMAIKFMIETRKIKGEEARNIISTMAGAVRQPNEEYMTAFFKLVKDQQDHDSLNETMILSFSELVHNAYVNRVFSHRQYPTHVQGNFATSAGRTFLNDEVIPYVTEKLNEAITTGDSRQILTYIRALGEIGDRQIIHTFQPYLEGKKPCSQFQRLWMVLSLRKVANVDPKGVGALLYRIYQNIGETTEIRVAAVYMLMHTSPSAEMLQRIAKYTNIDSNHRVCAAVKSAIQSAANLEGKPFAELRSAAESASHFLTKKEFGVQDPQDSLRSYAFHNWESYYKHVLQTIVSEESGIPSSLYLALEGEGYGAKIKTFTFESVISDIRNLMQVAKKNTNVYKQQRDTQKSTQQSEKSIWSSHNIARLLNLQTEELEQLEGIVSLQLGELKKNIMFDNHTIDSLPQYIQGLMLEWKNGKKIDYTKTFNNRDVTLAYPTETGLPFVLTYDLPIMIRLKGEVKAKVHPHIICNGQFVLPDKVAIGGEFKIAVSAKQQMKYGFVTPFNHHLYQVGRDDDVQVMLPVKIETNVDFKNSKLHLEVAPIEKETNVNILQVSSTPYTLKQDILDLDGPEQRKNVHVIRKNNPRKWQKVVGDQSTGIAFRINYENDVESITVKDLLEEFFEIGTPFKNITIEYVPKLSKNKKLITNIVYKRENQTNAEEQDGKALIDKLSKLSSKQDQRVSEIIQYSSAGIQNSRMQVLDSRVHFSGDQSVEYTLTVSYARNQEDSKSRLLAYVKKQSEKSLSRPFAGALSVKFDMARVNGLDMDYIMNTDLQSSVSIDGAFSETLPTDNQFEIHAELKRSNARKQYLMEQPSYHRCQNEIQQGNKQLLACANMTQMAGLLDSINMKMNYPKMNSRDWSSVWSAYNALINQHPFKIENKQQKLGQGELSLEVVYSPDLEKFNVSILSKDSQAYMKNKQIYPWARPIVVPHPIFNVIDRVEGKLFNLQTYKPICSMDKTEAYTFDGSEYPLLLNDYWTVLMQYVPLRSSGDSYSSVEEQLKYELENYVVLAKRSSHDSNEKDVKIVVSTPQTQGRTVEITLKSNSSNGWPQVFVDEKLVAVRQNGESETYDNQVTILGLPNSEIYVRVLDDFYVIYDGTRVKITSLGMKLRNRIRGLCGNFNSYRADDLTTSSNCVVRNPKDLIASYTVLQEGENSPEVNEYKKNAEKNRCIRKKLPLFVKYITVPQESDSQKSKSQQSGSCMKLQTRYVVENGQICFTIRPLNICRPRCAEVNTVKKSVEVHCVQNRNVASLWKNQIDKGANPDFSQKPVTKAVQLEIPQYCRSL